MTRASTDGIDLLRQFARSRDEAVFARIVQEYAGLVFAAGHRVLGSAAQAEEISQETFLKLLRRPEAATQSLAGWLHRVATQLAIDRVRSESARSAREADYTAPGQADQDLSWQELSPVIDQALAELPDDSRELLVEHFLQGVPQNELAAKLGVSPSTMSRRIKDGVIQLRGALSRRGVTGASIVIVALLERWARPAPPPALMAELGKMAMASGSLVPRTSPWIASAAKVGAVVCVLCLLAALVLGVGSMLWPDAGPAPTAPESASPDAEAVPTTPAGPFGMKPGVAYQIDSGESLRSDVIVMFTHNKGDDRLVLLYADTHSITVPMAHAQAAIEKQTGQPMDQVVATATRRILPGDRR